MGTVFLSVLNIPMRGLLKPLILLLITTLCFGSPVSLAYDDNTERRISIGLRLFRALLASDTNLQKKVDSDNQLNLLILSSDLSAAQLYADQLLNIGRGNKKGIIHNFPIQVSIISPAQLQTSLQRPIAGIYIVGKLSDSQRQAVIDYSISHSIISYSPFEGDVEEGVLAGIAIGIRVRPFINKNTLEQSGLTVKALFLKVAKIYED